jgi:sugar transport system substrate-binding protein
MTAAPLIKEAASFASLEIDLCNQDGPLSNPYMLYYEPRILLSLVRTVSVRRRSEITVLPEEYANIYGLKKLLGGFDVKRSILISLVLAVSLSLVFLGGPSISQAQEKTQIAGVEFQSDTFMQTVQAGMKAAADKAGNVDLVLGNSENDLTKEASLIDDYITRGVKAIVITPILADGSVAALERAKKAGITIICFNTCVKKEGTASAYLVTKNEDLGTTTGQAAVKFITDKLGGKAKIGLLNCDQFEGCPPRKEGFLKEVKALPGVEVVAV